jgi:dihydrolipoamide dehydrogenase
VAPLASPGPGASPSPCATGAEVELEAGAVIVAVGSHPRIPDLPGLDEIEPWTNRQGTATRELPKSLVILGAGPTGVELSQVYARYGVPVTLVQSGERINDRDHPKSSEIVAAALEADGVTIRLNVRAERISARGGTDGAHLVHLSDGSRVEGHEILLAVGRDFPVETLNLGAIGVEPSGGQLMVDDQLKLADGVYVAGDVAGPEMHTHLADYQGQMAARLALGDDVRPDHAAIPRAIYTDPEAASVGLRLEEARERGIDAAEFSADLARPPRATRSRRRGIPRSSSTEAPGPSWACSWQAPR